MDIVTPPDTARSPIPPRNAALATALEQGGAWRRPMRTATRGRVESLAFVFPLLMTALIAGGFDTTAPSRHPRSPAEPPVTADDVDASNATRRLGTTRGPPVRVQCPLDGNAVEVTPIKSRLHRPLLHGGPNVEKIYTCPACGYAGTASDWTSSVTPTEAGRRRLRDELTEWAHESPAGRAALLHVDDDGQVTFARALLAARLANTNADRTRWLETALASSGRVSLDDVAGHVDGAATGSHPDLDALRAALRASVLLELGRTADAQRPLGLLDRSSPELSSLLRTRFGLMSLPGWW